MPYDRDQVIAAVTDYYNFLTRLHLDSEDIRRPPPEGWSQISEKRLSPLNKSEEVISLLKHLPYVQNDENFSPFLVWTLSGCNDYTGWDFQKAIEGGSTSSMMPEDIETAPEDCTWEKLHKPYPHTIPLASPASKYGDYIMCDTEDGEFVIWSFWEDGYKSFPNAGECFAHLKKAYLEMKMFPVSKEEMRELREGNQRDKEITRLAKEHGWPSEGFQWHKFLAAAKAAGLPGFRV